MITCEDFIITAKKYIADKTGFDFGTFHLVWFSKTLNHKKALFMTTKAPNWYFEVTENGSKEEIYIDSYTKVTNEVLDYKEYERGE